MGLLAGGDVLAGVRNSDNRDVVIVTAEEVLGPGDDVTEHDGGTEWVHDVLIVGVEHEALSHPTYTHQKRLRSRLQRSIGTSSHSHNAHTSTMHQIGGVCLPWKPITAESSSSCSIVSLLCESLKLKFKIIYRY